MSATRSAAGVAHELQRRPSPEDALRAFVSPFSIGQGYTLHWQNVAAGWRGNEDVLLRLTERDAEILQVLAECRMATSLQLLKCFFPRNLKTTGKERLRKLAGNGVLLSHLMENRSRKVIICTLGPIGARVAQAPYEPNWYCSLDVSQTLRYLITVELYLKMRRVMPVQLSSSYPPYTGVLAAGENRAEFGVIALRRGENLAGPVPWFYPPKLLVIAEDEAQAFVAAGRIGGLARFTTDEALFTEPLHLTFRRYRDGRLETDIVRQFMPFSDPEGQGGP